MPVSSTVATTEAALRRDAHGHPAAGVGVLDRVAGEVGEQAVQLLGLPGHEHRLVGHVGPAGDAAGGGRRVALVADVEDDPSQVDRLGVELAVRVGDLGHGEHVVDDGPHPGGAAGRGRDGPAAVVVETRGVEELEVGAHREERVAQLVAHRVDHLDAVAVELAEPVGDGPLELELAGLADRQAEVAADVARRVDLDVGPAAGVGDTGQDQEAHALAGRPRAGRRAPSRCRSGRGSPAAARRRRGPGPAGRGCRGRRARRTGRPSSGAPDARPRRRSRRRAARRRCRRRRTTSWWCPTPSGLNAVSHMPTASKHDTTADRHASSTSSSVGSPRAWRTIARASVGHPHLLAQLLALEGEEHERPRETGVLGQHLHLLRRRQPAVVGDVDRQQAAQPALVVVERRGEEVERVPRVLALEGGHVGDVAVGERLDARPVVRHEAPHAPLVGVAELVLDRPRGHLRADEAVLDAGRGDDLEVAVAAQRQRRLLEAGEGGDTLDEDLQVLSRLLVRPRGLGMAPSRVRFVVHLTPCVASPSRHPDSKPPDLRSAGVP